MSLIMVWTICLTLAGEIPYVNANIIDVRPKAALYALSD